MKALRLLGYLGWFFGCFFIGVVLTAPLDLFKPLATQRLEVMLGKGTQGERGFPPVVTIDSIKVSGLGLKATRVHAQLKNTDPEPGPDVDIDDVWISMRSLLSFIGSEKRIDASAHLYGGDVSVLAHLDEKQNPTDITAEIDDVDLAKVTILMAKLGLPVEGKIHADVELELGKQADKDASGHIDVDIKGLALAAGNLKLMPGGMEFAEPIRLGDLKGRVPVKQGQGTLESLKFEGNPDVEAEVTGTLSIKAKLEASRLDADGWFRPTKPMLEKNPKINSAIDLGEKLMGLNKAKDDEGRYHFSVKGPLQSLNPQFSKDAGRKAKTKASKGTPVPVAPPPPPPEEPAPTP